MELYHFGIKGMKWGVRRFEDKSGRLTPAGKERYYEESDKKIKANSDGSYTVPSGFKFNRVGQKQLDINKSGALYMSYGKDDAARYVKNLGPTKIGKLLGQYGDTVQHISAKKNLRMPNDNEVATITAKTLLSNKKMLDTFNESIFSSQVYNDFTRKITEQDLQKAVKNPESKEAQRIAYGVSAFLADPNYTKETKTLYSKFRESGYDAIPDIHDRMSGTSSTALIVLNTDKVEMTSSTAISKDIMKEAKRYVKTLEKLKVSELLND